MRAVNKKRLKLVIRLLLMIFFLGYGAVFVKNHSEDMRIWYSTTDYRERFQKEYGMSYSQWSDENESICRAQAMAEAKKITTEAKDQWGLDLEVNYRREFEFCIKPHVTAPSNHSFAYFYAKNILGKPYTLWYLLSFISSVLFIPYLLVNGIPYLMKSFFNWVTKQD